MTATRILIVLATALLLAVPPTTAQTLTDPLERRVSDKAGAAQESPVDFVEDHASVDGVRREGEWGVAYGCYAIHRVHTDYGTPDPELEQCEDYADVIGVDEEPVDEPVAEVEELKEDVVADVEDLEEGLEEDIVALVEEPTEAPNILQRMIARIARFVEDLVDSAVGTASDALGTLDDLGIGIMDAVGSTLGDAKASVVDTASITGDLIGDTSARTGSAVEDVASAIDDAASGISTWVRELLGDAPSREVDGPAKDTVGDVEDAAGDLLVGLPTLGEVVGE